MVKFLNKYGLTKPDEKGTIEIQQEDTNMSDEFLPDILSLTDDEDNEYNFEVLDRIETDDGRYVALLPVYDDPQDQLDDSGELVILKVFEEDGEEYLEQIEDEDEYVTISDAFINRLQDLYEIEE